MQPYKFTVNDIFEKERRYVIPLYQRAYVWKQEDNWEPFWDDVRRSAEECFSTSETETDDIRTHFLGAVVWSLSKTVGKAVARAEVIDGQQRLTTLQLLLAALRDIARELGAKDFYHADRWTANPSKDSSSDEFFKLWPSNADRASFRAVMTAGSREAVKALYPDNTPLPRMAEAYLFFDQAIRDFVAAKDAHQSDSDRLEAVSSAMRASLQCVVIELEHGDDPQVIFETLNARGQPLLPSDLIRNYVFLQAAKLGPDTSDRLYDNYWRAFDETRSETPDETGETRFWHQFERQGRLTRPRIDLFIFHFLIMQMDRELNIGHIFREFRIWYAQRQKLDGNIDKLLSELQAASKNFARLVNPSGQDRVGVLARRLKSLDTSTVYPFLLYLLSLPNKTLPPTDLTNIIVDLESFMVRRFVCNLTTKNYNKFFLGLLTKTKQAAEAGLSVTAAVRQELLRAGDPTTRWPNDEEFLRAWKSIPVYVKSRSDRSGMLLRAIEEQLRTSKNEMVVLADKLTVEHLLPQQGSLTDYPYATPMPLAQDETKDQCRSRMINTIGNLTLLTGSLNAAASNGAFPKKREKIVEDSDLRLNAWLRGDKRAAWSEADILDRAVRLFDTAVKIWPYPQAAE